MDTGKLKRRAFRLWKSIDKLEDGYQKQRLIKDWVRVIWQIQDNRFAPLA